MMTLRLWIALAFFITFYAPLALAIGEWLHILNESGSHHSDDIVWNHTKIQTVLRSHRQRYPNSPRVQRFWKIGAMALTLLGLAALLLFWPALVG
jgi:hypothetical protein